MNLFYIFVLFVILERLFELRIAHSNKLLMLSRGAIEYDNASYKLIVLLHVLFICSIVFEFNLTGKINYYSTYLFSIFVLLQIFRYWCIFSLGYHWNTRVLVVPGEKLIKKGPYRFLNHPNYIIVSMELITIPLIFSLYFSCIIFSIANLILLVRRTRIENTALEKLKN